MPLSQSCLLSISRPARLLVAVIAGSVYTRPIDAWRHQGYRYDDRPIKHDSSRKRGQTVIPPRARAALRSARLSGSERTTSLLSSPFSLPLLSHYATLRSHCVTEIILLAKLFGACLVPCVFFLSVMENRKEILSEGGQLGTTVGKAGSNLSEAVGSPLREQRGKIIHRNCTSPGASLCSRDRADEEVDSTRRSLCADVRPVIMSSSTERPQHDHNNKDGSSTDTESDFYEEIDVSCTPESMDYPNGKGKSHDTVILFVTSMH